MGKVLGEGGRMNLVDRGKVSLAGEGLNNLID